MNLAKKLGYLILALGIGATGIHEFRSYKKIKDLQEYSTELKSQQELLSKNLSELENKLNSQNQEQDALKTDLEELASALREENLSQENKIDLLNKYASVVRVVINKENKKINELTKADETVANLVNEVSSKLEDVRTNLSEIATRTHEPGNLERFEKIVAPTVRVSCAQEVGSGTIIYCKQNSDIFRSYVLTAEHVIDGAVKEEKSITAEFFINNGEDTISFEGTLLEQNTALDLAIFQILCDSPLPSAKLISKDKIEQVQRFDDVYAVGCPLGYSPMQTEGEITIQNKILGNQNIWMVNAPAIFGNSGGGIYLAKTNELIGLLSRVSAYNNFINVAVPHMGIIIPPDKIYDWFERSNLQFLYDDNVSREECFRRREAQNTEVKTSQPEVNTPSVIPPVVK